MQTSVLRDLKIDRFGVSLFTAFFIALLELIFVLAFTALMYSGELASQIPNALGFIILGDAVLCLIGAFFSSNPIAITVEQDAPGAMLAVVTASVIAALSGAVKQQFATVTVMIVTSTLLTGVLLLLLGYFKLGGIVRFLPYPVIGGFLAGSGWLLVQGGISIMTGTLMNWSWLQPEYLRLWLPGTLLAFACRWITHRNSKPYTIPVLLISTTILFYAITWMTNQTVASLRTSGWLLDSTAPSSLWRFPLAPSFLEQVNWHVLVSQLPAIIPIALICAIGLLLNSSGMELLTKKDLNLNRELIVAGYGNLAAAFAGGLVGFQDISFSTLNHVMGGKGRLVGVLTALMLGTTLFLGTAFIAFVPKFILGSVLIYLGLELLGAWVYDAWFKFSRVDFAVVITILVILAAVGVLQSIIAGLILAVIMFAVSYSRISVIKFAFSGREFRSRVSHPVHEQQVLDLHGNKLYIMKLEGFIFFGTANAIFDAVRERTRTPGIDELLYCLIDFSKVSGTDSTGLLSFNRMVQWCQEQGIKLVFSSMDSVTRDQIMKENPEQLENLNFLPNIDRAVEWCENEIIHKYFTDLHIHQEIVNQLNEILKNESAEGLIPYMQRLEYEAGEYLIREGGIPDFIYFVHSGQVTAQLEMPGQDPIRLETIYSGRAVGEIAFYLGTKRTASVIADQNTVVYSLSANDLRDMETNEPEIANIFHRLNVLLLSERVMHLTRTVRALERS